MPLTRTSRHTRDRARRHAATGLLLAALIAAGCQIQPPPGPTEIPTEQPTASPSPSPTLSPQPEAPTATQEALRPLVTSTALATPLPAVEVVQPTDTPGPICFTVRPNETLSDLIFRAGYANLSPLPAVRQLNGLPPNSNAIQVGQQICIPRPTATPTPLGGEHTATARARELALPTRAFAISTYVIRSNDNITSIQLNTGASLRDICELNDPTVINCAGCNLDRPIGEQGCRPIVRAGQTINVPGPAPTATITPTLTGNETATPTPAFAMPRLVSPVNRATESGAVQLVWLPVGLLQPDEFYLVMWTDMATGQTWQARTPINSFRLPMSLEPADGQTHTINWQVGVAREGADGSYVLISPMSLIYSFTWLPR